MPMDLSSYGPELIYAEGEPYDSSEPAVNAQGKPVSLYSALCMLSDKEWKVVATYFKFRGPKGTPKWRYLRDHPEIVIEQAEKVNLVTQVRGHVEVWLDPSGWCRVNVW